MFLLNDATEIRMRIVKEPFEVNVRLDPIAQHYITGHKKKIELLGPVFTMVRVEFL